MELQLPIWVYLVSLALWVFAGYVWGRLHEQRRSRKTPPRAREGGGL